jgi:2-polyprenyl-3-methyl-5-hydroxy-6-metoxy-1,4-benzoquinol methylase
LNELLFDTANYWDERHQHVNEWQAGGDRGLSIHRNRAFYAHRLGLLTTILDRCFIGERFRILDAGCGKGWLAQQLYEQGHSVDGVDFSEAAIKICRKHRRGTFHVSPLESFTSRYLFDAVIAVDVLFHVLDDRIWERVVRNLCSLTKADGVLIFADDLTEQRYQLGDYIVHRSRQQYEALLNKLGMEIINQYSYAFGDNPNKFYVAKRVR